MKNIYILRNSWLVKQLFNSNNNSCQLTTVYRFNETQLLQAAYECAYGKRIVFKRYGNKECELSLCWTNLCVDTLSSKYNDKYAKSHNNVKEVKGHGNTKLILHNKLHLMAYIMNLNKYT